MKTNWNACRKLLPRHAPARNGRNLEGCTALASHLGKSETKSQMIVINDFLSPGRSASRAGCTFSRMHALPAR